MNNSINYSGFVEMFINSDDDFEPYGCVDTLTPAAEGQHTRSNHIAQHQDRIIDDTHGD